MALPPAMQEAGSSSLYTSAPTRRQGLWKRFGSHGSIMIAPDVPCQGGGGKRPGRYRTSGFTGTPSIVPLLDSRRNGRTNHPLDRNRRDALSKKDRRTIAGRYDFVEPIFTLNTEDLQPNRWLLILPKNTCT